MPQRLSGDSHDFGFAVSLRLAMFRKPERHGEQHHPSGRWSLATRWHASSLGTYKLTLRFHFGSKKFSSRQVQISFIRVKGARGRYVGLRYGITHGRRGTSWAIWISSTNSVKADRLACVGINDRDLIAGARPSLDRRPIGISQITGGFDYVTQPGPRCETHGGAAWTGNDSHNQRTDQHPQFSVAAYYRCSVVANGDGIRARVRALNVG